MRATIVSTRQEIPRESVQLRPAFRLVEGYTVASVLAALEMAGLLDELATGGLDPAARAGGGEEARALLCAAFDYLRQRGLLELGIDGFELTQMGREVCEDKGYLVWLSGGYSEPLHHLSSFLLGDATYGEEHVRDGRWVADGSALLGARDVVPEAMDMLGELSFERVLDLGCGNAKFLISLCERFGSAGIGVDLSDAACNEARRAAAASNLQERVRIVCGDAVDLELVALEETQLVIAFFLLHEISSISWTALIDFLGVLAARLPAGAHLVAAEVEPAAPEYADGKRFTPEFTFMHAMMRQKLLSEDEWRRGLAEGGFAVDEIVRSRQPGGLLIRAHPVKA